MTELEVIKKISEETDAGPKQAERVVMKAKAGGEIESSLEDWLKERFLPNVVCIDEEGYTRMCVDALKILSTTAATDYGSSRQRDLGQLWADMTRGYLGELAFSKFLEKKCVKNELGHELGDLRDYLPSDIDSIQRPGQKSRPPKIQIGVKATKWNGIWLDLPGDQFNHSDVHVLVKVGTGRDHLFAFFKEISVFKDKVLKKGEEAGVLTSDEAGSLFDNLPGFSPVPAYI